MPIMQAPVKPSHSRPAAPLVRYNRPAATRAFREIFVRAVNAKHNNRRDYPVVLLATMSGMGKTTYGKFATEHLLAALEDPYFLDTINKASYRAADRNELFDLLTNRTRTIFVDFNGSGDALLEREAQSPGDIIGPRLAARGLFNVPIEVARTHAEFSINEQHWHARNVIPELWRRLRAERTETLTNQLTATEQAKQTAELSDERKAQLAADAKALADSQPVMLIVHVDEYQLAHEILVNKGHNAKNATDIIAGQVVQVVQANMDPDINNPTVNDIALVLLTGTSRAGFTMHVTKHGVEYLPLEPLGLEVAIDHVVAGWAKAGCVLHPNWKQCIEFRRFIADLGGVPKLLNSLIAAWDAGLASEPGAIKQQFDVLDELTDQVAASVVTNYKPSDFAAMFATDHRELQRLAQVVLAHIPVPVSMMLSSKNSSDSSTKSIERPKNSIESLALAGMIITTPHRGEFVTVECPIPILGTALRQTVQQPGKICTFRDEVLQLFKFPFPRSGRILEMAGLVSQTARLQMISDFRGPQDSWPLSVILAIEDVLQLHGFAAQETLNQRVVLPRATFRAVLGAKQFLFDQTRPTLNDALEGVDAWLADGKLSTTLLPDVASEHPVVLPADGTPDIDQLFALERPAPVTASDPVKPLLIMTQYKNILGFGGADAAMLHPELRKAIENMEQSPLGQACDLVFVFIITGNALSTTANTPDRVAAANKRVARILASTRAPVKDAKTGIWDAKEGNEDKRIIVLIGNDIRPLIPMLWHRVPQPQAAQEGGMLV